MQHSGTWGVDDASFSEAVRREFDELMGEKRSYGAAQYQYIQRGYYMDQIERFLQHFSREQLHIVIAEHMKKDPDGTYGRIFDFLGVRHVDLEITSEFVGSYKEKIPTRVKNRLVELYRSHNERLYNFLGYRIEEWEQEYADDKPADQSEG